MRARSFNVKYLTTTAQSIIEGTTKQFKEITAPSKTKETMSFLLFSINQLKECYFWLGVEGKQSQVVIFCYVVHADGKRYQTKVSLATSASHILSYMK